MKSQVLKELCEVVSRRSFKAPSKMKNYVKGMTECRTTRYGGRVVQCPDCGKTQVLYNSCNKRGCPICYRHRQKQWEAHVRVRILHTNHFHLVFSIPEAYTGVWLLHKKEVMNAFFESVKKAIGKRSIVVSFFVEEFHRFFKNLASAYFGIINPFCSCSIHYG